MATTEISISPEMIAEAVRNAHGIARRNERDGNRRSETHHGQARRQEGLSAGPKRPDLVRSATGLSVNEITLEKAVAGKLTFDDVGFAPKPWSIRRRFARAPVVRTWQRIFAARPR